MLRRLLIGVLLVAGAVSTSAAELGWSRYTNERFGASAMVPRGLFLPEPPPTNGDGQIFRSREDGAMVRIFGTFYTAASDSFAAYKTSTIASAKDDGLAITYQTSGSGFFVYSGLKGGTIVYAKTIIGCRDVADTVEIEYPAAARSLYDPIVTRIAASLEGRRGVQCR